MTTAKYHIIQVVRQGGRVPPGFLRLPDVRSVEEVVVCNEMRAALGKPPLRQWSLREKALLSAGVAATQMTTAQKLEAVRAEREWLEAHPGRNRQDMLRMRGE